ncbi:Complement C1q-like protein 2, partial [Biomphalaria glabrata]
VETAIIVNDKEVARIYSGAHDAHGSGSNAAVVDLRTGDSVWVRLLYQGGNHVHGYYSTFSGALIRPSE